jgi:cytochrome c2
MNIKAIGARFALLLAITGMIAIPTGGLAAPAAGPMTTPKQLLERNNCLMCHSIANNGGCLAPPFDGIGQRRGRQFILSRITASKAAEAEFERLYGMPELMPHPRIPAKTAASITSYLMQVPAPKKGFAISGHRQTLVTNKPSPEQQKTRAAVEKGKKLYYDSGCAACHSLGKVGGQFAPGLDGISKRRSRDSIFDTISRGHLQREATADKAAVFMMPPADLPPDAVEAITDFLMGLPKRH